MNKVKMEHIIVLKRGIESVRDLIEDSVGVAGLHMNGDIATWNELEEGGRFEEWLMLFNDAEDLIKEIYDTWESE